jgi:hypothetical protein
MANTESKGNDRSFLRSLNHRQRIAVIIVVGMLCYGGMIIADGLFVRQWLDSSFGPTPDLPVYQERTSLILNGGIIYRDLDIESPPLINYVLLPPQMIGGEWWAYEVYFSFFIILTALTMYLVLSRWDGYRAMLVSLLLLFCPFALQDATWGIQDEPVVAFFYLLPVLLMLSGRTYLSSIAAAFGFWTKFLPVIIYPDILVRLKDRREVLRNIAIAVIASVLIALPFLLLCPIEFLNFPSYYLLGRSGEGSAGMSLINLIGQGGFVIPGAVGAALTVGVLALTYYLVRRWDLDIWRGAMLTTVVFLSVYPMIRLSYYIFPFAFFAVWAISDRGILIRLVPMYLTLLFAQGLAADGLGVDPAYSWIIASVLVVAGTLIMLDITMRCLRTKNFLDSETREGPTSA